MFDPLGEWTTGNGTKMAMRTRQNIKSVQHSPGNSPVSHAKLWVGVLTLLLIKDWCRLNCTKCNS